MALSSLKKTIALYYLPLMVKCTVILITKKGKCINARYTYKMFYKKYVLPKKNPYINIKYKEALRYLLIR